MITATPDRSDDSEGPRFGDDQHFVHISEVAARWSKPRARTYRVMIVDEGASYSQLELQEADAAFQRHADGSVTVLKSRLTACDESATEWLRDLVA